jgi:hypothetical protein
MGIEQENPFNTGEPMWPNVTPEQDAVLKKHFGNPKNYTPEEEEEMRKLYRDDRDDYEYDWQKEAHR